MTRLKRCRAVCCYLGILLLLMCGMSCRPAALKRPFGELKLGVVTQFPEGETFLDDKRAMIRRSSEGLSMMSTLCTYDLSPLTPGTFEGKRAWLSSYTTSAYDWDGKVLRGPASVDLPYYELILGSESLESPKNILYAKIGSEKPASWRLRVNTPQ